MDDEPAPRTEPPKIREKPRTGCVVFVMSAVMMFVMFALANWIFPPSDERHDKMKIVSGVIGIVGIGWSVVLMARAGDDNWDDII